MRRTRRYRFDPKTVNPRFDLLAIIGLEGLEQLAVLRGIPSDVFTDSATFPHVI